MKKLFLSMLTAVMLFASCSQEEIISQTSGESVVSFTVTTPELASRAVGDGTTATDLYFVVYDETTGEQVETISSKDAKYASFTNLKAEIALPLLNGHEYSLIFWAQSANGAYTINWDTKSIALTNETALVSNNEKYDAFYAYVEPFVVTGEKQSTIQLKRPFAQLNIGTATKDLEGVAQYYGVDKFTKSSIVVTTPTAMDLTTGNVSAEKELTYAAAEFISSEKMKDNYEYLSMNYLLVSNEKSLVNVDFSIIEGTKTISKTFENIPVQRNYKTNIYGSLFTSATDWTVEVKPVFETPDNDFVVYAVSTEAELKKAAETGASITLTNDITLTADLTFNNNVEINGQSYAINGRRIVFAGESVSLRNTKFIGATAEDIEASNVYVQGNNKIFVAENCEFSNSEYEGIQYTSENATNVTINNCIFKTEENIARAIHLQVKEVSDAQVVITNNKIFNGENYTANSDDADIVCIYGFAAAGMTLEGNVVYDVTALDETLIWISDGKAVNTIGTEGFELGGSSVSTATDLATAFASKNSVSLSGNVISSTNISLPAGSVLDGVGNSFYMNNLEETNGLALGFKVAGGTVKNLTIDGQNQRSVANNKGYRAIYIENPQENVVFDNVIIKGVLYPINTGIMSSAVTGVTLTVTNSTLEGWSSFSGFASAEIKDCHFPMGTYYSEESIYNQGIAPYVTTVFENCDFAKGYFFDLTKFTGTSITFKNCTVDGVAITKDSFEKVTNPDASLVSKLSSGKSLWFEESATFGINNVTIQ